VYQVEMEAGISDHVRELEEVIGLLDQSNSKIKDGGSFTRRHPPVLSPITENHICYG
jgi:hypothetical protein